VDGRMGMPPPRSYVPKKEGFDDTLVLNLTCIPRQDRKADLVRHRSTEGSIRPAPDQRKINLNPPRIF